MITFLSPYRNVTAPTKAITAVNFPVTPALATTFLANSSPSSHIASEFFQRLQKTNRLHLSSANLTSLSESAPFKKSTNTLNRVLHEFSGDLLIRITKITQQNQKNYVM